MHLKHNSCRCLDGRAWPTPYACPTVICLELLGGIPQPVTGRLAIHPSNTTVKIQILQSAPNFGATVIHRLHRGAIRQPKPTRCCVQVPLPVGNRIRYSIGAKTNGDHTCSIFSEYTFCVLPLICSIVQVRVSFESYDHDQLTYLLITLLLIICVQ